MFSHKRLRVEISKYKTSFINGEEVLGSKTSFIFDDFRINCKIKKVPATCGYTATVDIYGVSQQHLNQITNIYWINGKVTPMSVRVLADDGNGYVTVFEGGVMMAVPNYNSVPDVSIHIESSMMAFPNLDKHPPTNLSPGSLISDVCKSLCSTYNLKADPAPELNVPYTGTVTKQLNQKSFGARVRELCRLADLEFAYRTNTVVFYKRGKGKRKGWKLTPSKYIGYPNFETFGISVKTENVTTNYNCGDAFTISGSIIPQANATWIINSIEYDLDSRKEGGKWELKMHGTRTEVKDG